MATRELIRKAQAHVPEDDLEDIVGRIAAVANPEKIILFGSAIKEPLDWESDLDFLVIKRGDFHTVTAAQEIYDNLDGVKYPIDIIVTTPEKVEKYGDCFALILYPALKEGKVVYDRQAA